MRSFSQLNPIVITIYFVAVLGIVMFCLNPIILLVSLFGAVALNLIINGCKDGRSHMYSIVLFVILSLINPFVSHNGVTVLFVMNNKPVTFEALVYGIVSGVMVVSVLYMFRTFSVIMTSDKLLYIFGGISPKLALILSMTLRYVPLFNRQAKKVENTGRALGIYKEDNVVDNFKGKLRIFGIMATWALENGIITADSMTARGYGVGKRSCFYEFRIYKDDIIFLILCVVLSGFTIMGIKDIEFDFYPAIKMSELTIVGVVGYISYGILVSLPIIIEVKEILKWKYLRSKI